MTTEIVQDKNDANDWRVEDIDSKTGECYVTIFSGPKSEERAKTYGRLDHRWRIPK